MVFLKVTDFGSNYIKDKKKKRTQTFIQLFADGEGITSVPTPTDSFFFLI